MNIIIKYKLYKILEKIKSPNIIKKLFEHLYEENKLKIIKLKKNTKYLKYINIFCDYLEILKTMIRIYHKENKKMICQKNIYQKIKNHTK